MDKEERSKLSKKLWQKPGHRRLQHEGLKAKWQEDEYKQKISAARKGKQTRKYIKTCQQCGKKFGAVRRWTKFCSPRCRTAWHREKKNK